MPVIEHNLAVIASAEPSRNFGTRLMLGSYFADIVTDVGRTVFHWIVQPVGSLEILQMGQEISFAGALERAHQCLESLVAQDRNKTRRAALYKFGDLGK